jgi:hypothetical protein
MGPFPVINHTLRMFSACRNMECCSSIRLSSSMISRSLAIWETTLLIIAIRFAATEAAGTKIRLLPGPVPSGQCGRLRQDAAGSPPPAGQGCSPPAESLFVVQFSPAVAGIVQLLLQDLPLAGSKTRRAETRQTRGRPAQIPETHSGFHQGLQIVQYQGRLTVAGYYLAAADRISSTVSPRRITSSCRAVLSSQASIWPCST